MKKNKSPLIFNREYVVLGLLLCVFFLTVSLIFLFYMMEQGQKESISYLWQDTQQKQISIESKVQGDMQTLDGVASFTHEVDSRDSESLVGVLQKVNDRNDFSHMGLADKAGNVRFVKIGGKLEKNVNLRQEPFFQKALKGEQAVSDAYESPFEDKTHILYYAVPVFDDANRVVGVLCAIDNVSLLLNTIDTPVFKSKGFSDLVDGAGNFVVYPENSMAAKAKAHDLSQVGVYTETELAAMMKAIKDHKRQPLTYKVDGESYQMVVEPTNINGWCIISSVPKSVLRETYSRIVVGVVIIILAAIIVFLLLFNYQWNTLIRNQKKLQELAYVDPLTGCRNFSKFSMDAHRFVAAQRRYAVWYCDLKNFKYVNDLFGYRQGDALLKLLGKAFDLSDSKGIFCRSAADNFVGICPYESQEQLEEWFHGVVNFIQKESDIDTEYVQIYMGFYCHEKHGEQLTINDMVDRANIAQESIKTASHSACTFFTEELRLKNLRNTAMEAEGKAALQRDDFILYFQPKINIQKNNRLVGTEVLVRWQHPERGLISPGEFIPLFEKRGLIVTLDRYVFDKACQWTKAYLDEGNDPIIVAVNVSQLGLLKADFVDYYTSVKDKYGIPDHILELEFTESVLLEEGESSAGIVARLQKNGFYCSIDDFGAGYSSLNMLKNLHVDTLKLDMGFFQKEGDSQRTRTVISNIVNMAKELSMNTIAEGVETVEMVDFLKKHECNIVQGYVFERPMSQDKFEDLLKKKKGEPFTPQDC